MRCTSWQQLATIYKRDLSRGTMFLKASAPPPVGTKVRIDLALPSASVIALSGVVAQHVSDPTRGAGVDLKLDPLPSSSVWLIESALAAETKVRAESQPGAVATTTPATGVPAIVKDRPTGPQLQDGADIASAENELIAALISEAESLRKLNPFLVLGVGYEATDADVRAAFGELTKRYHPDRFARYESADLRKVAAEIFILIRDAYRKISDEPTRAAALQALGKASAPRAVPAKAPPPPPPLKTGRLPAINVRTEPGVIPGSRTPASGVPVISTSSPGSAGVRAGSEAGAPAPERPTPPPAPQRPPVRAATEPGVPVERPTPAPSASASQSGLPAQQPSHVQSQAIPSLGSRPAFPRAPTPPPVAAPPTPPTTPAVQTSQNTLPMKPAATVPASPAAKSQPNFRDSAAAKSQPSFRDSAAAKSSSGASAPTTPIANQTSVPPVPDTGRPVLHQQPAATAAAESGDPSGLDALLDAGKFEEAIASYKLLAKKHPTERGYRAGLELVEGLRALAQRDRMEAAQRFEAALEIDPSNERAARELAEMRRQATNERKGLLSRLMGKKEG
nr:DnaJ domain-containing protein [Kofleriaceae bacterium]